MSCIFSVLGFCDIVPTETVISIDYIPLLLPKKKKDVASQTKGSQSNLMLGFTKH